MIVPFNTLPSKSRVWVYQSSRIFSDNEITKIRAVIEPFLSHWQRHGQDLTASYKIIYNQFLVIAVNDEVSGCSIDASMHLIRQIEKEFRIDLTDKLQIAFRYGSNINIVSLTDFKRYIGQNKITPNTIVFNNMVDTIEGLQKNWEVPAKDSWHKKYFK